MEEQERRRQAREAWRRARDEMREAFREAWRAGGLEYEARRTDNFELFVQELVAKAKKFGSEVGEEARRFGRDFADDARRHAEEKRKGLHEERHHGEHRERRGEWQEHWLFGGRRFQNWAGGDVEANPILAAMMSKGVGLLSLYVLHLLSEQPRHGNDLMKELERRTMGNWTSNPGAVYPLLSDLEGNGLVFSNWEEPDKRTKRIYQITDRGREELARLRQVLRPKLMDTIDVLHDIYDDLYASSSDEPPAKADAGEATTPPPAEDQSEGQTQLPIEARGDSVADALRQGVRSLVDKVLRPGLERTSQMGA